MPKKRKKLSTAHHATTPPWGRPAGKRPNLFFRKDFHGMAGFRVFLNGIIFSLIFGRKCIY
jgi:hypothetical protein